MHPTHEVQLLGAGDVRRLATQIGITPRKSWGQNFVHDANTIRGLIHQIDYGAQDHLLEIGPGLGSLTLGLLSTGLPVSAVEIDPRLAQCLPDTARHYAGSLAKNLRVYCADALRIDPSNIDICPTVVVANLPYNIATGVILHLLGSFPTIRQMLVMVQAEVADRLAAIPGNRHYGIPSVKVRFFAQVSKRGIVPPTVFWPVPHVMSGIVHLQCDPPPPWPLTIHLRQAVFRLIDQAFGQRRKTIRNCLVSLAGSTLVAQQWLDQAHINPMARSETLTIEQFITLASCCPPGVLVNQNTNHEHS